MKITDFLKEDCVIIGLKNRSKEGAINELLTLLEERGYIRNKKNIFETIMEREKLGSTGIGQGIAIPHAKTDQIDNLVGALGISKHGVDFDSLDGEFVYIIFLVLAPTESIGNHLKALAKIARLLKDKVFRNALRNSKDAKEAIKTIMEDEEKLSNMT